jgi:RNA polymerase sigma factor (sigma-70 family)
MPINFETFEEEHGADLKKYIRSKMLGTFEMQDHDDVWQEMLVQLIERDQRDDLPPIEDGKNYAFFVLKNVINKYISDKLNREELFVPLDTIEWGTMDTTPWGRQSSPEDEAIFNEAVENLSRPAAEAYQSVRDGLTIAEQAAIFGISERTAKRSRAKLREELQEAIL